MQQSTFDAAANSFQKRMLERKTIEDIQVSLCHYARMLRTPHPRDLFPLLLTHLKEMSFEDDEILIKTKEVWRLFIIQYVSDNELAPLSEKVAYEECLQYLEYSQNLVAVPA